MTREWEKLFAQVYPWSTRDSAGNLRGAMGTLLEGGDAMALLNENGLPRAVLSYGPTAQGWATAFSPAVGGRPDGDFAMDTNFQNGSELGITLFGSGMLGLQVRGLHAASTLHLAPDLTPSEQAGQPSIATVRDSIVAAIPTPGWLRLLPDCDRGEPLWWKGCWEAT